MDHISGIKNFDLKITIAKIHKMPDVSFTEIGPSTGLSIK